MLPFRQISRWFIRSLGLFAAVFTLTFLALALFTGRASADDGGWQECQNSGTNYLMCDGAIAALTISGVTATGSVIGVILAAAGQGVMTAVAAAAVSGGGSPQQPLPPGMPSEAWMRAVNENMRALLAQVPELLGESIDVIDLLDAAVTDANGRFMAAAPTRPAYQGALRAGFLERQDFRLIPGLRNVQIAGLEQLNRPLFAQYYLRKRTPTQGDLYAGDFWSFGHTPQRIGAFTYDPVRQVYTAHR